jgi:hypothetical protein
MLNVEDRLAIHELIALYGHIIDERQFSRTREVFTEDAVYDVSDFGVGVIVGSEAIVELWSRPDAAHPLAHHATNVLVTPLSPTRARVASKGIGVGRAGGTGSATYLDIVEKRPEGWRIVERKALLRRPEAIPAVS